jgi:hypothetical protein
MISFLTGIISLNKCLKKRVCNFADPLFLMFFIVSIPGDKREKAELSFWLMIASILFKDLSGGSDACKMQL